MGGAALRVWVTPYTHHVYYDEYGHFEKAISWSTPGKAAPVSRHMPGWSFLMSLAFMGFGSEAATGFRLSAIISILAIPLVYCFISGFTEDRSAPLWGALITALLPLHLRYSASMDTDQISFAFLCLALAALSFYIRDPRRLTFCFMLVSAIWTIYIRQENVIYLLIALSCAGWFRVRSAKRPGAAGLAGGLALTLAACLPYIFHNLINLRRTIYGQYFVDQGVSAAMTERFLLNAGYFFRNTSHPLLITLLALAGAAGLLWEKKRAWAAAVCAVWLAGYFVVYLFIGGHFK
jgi:hypothetical protein